MTDSLLPSVSLFLGIIPAFVLLYISLKGYDELYKEKHLYLTFIIGCILGVVSVLIETAVAAGIGLFFVVLLFPILEQVLKTMVLNIRRFQTKKETVIYGLSLGLGFGSIFTPFSLINTESRIESPITSILIVWIVIGSFGIILLHGATGALVGYAVYTRKMTRYISSAVLVYIPVVLFTNIFIGESLQIGIVVYGGIIYWYVTTKILPQIQPDHRRRQRQSKQRKTI